MAGGLRERSVAIRRYGITYRGGIYLKKNKTMIVVFLTPAVLLFLGIFLYPIIRTVIMSFFKIDGVTDSMDLWKFVGFGNYTKLMSTSLFKTSFFNLFRIWLIGGLVVMSLSLLFAVILTSGIRGKKFFRAIIYMPNIVSAVALATMWLQYVYSPRYGLLKDLFTALHLDNLAKTQFLDNDHKFWALLLSLIHIFLLPFAKGLEKLACLTIRDKKEDVVVSAEDREFRILEPRFLEKPAFAAHTSSGNNHFCLHTFRGITFVIVGNC